MSRYEEAYIKYTNGEKTIEELGKELGVTRERIRQMIVKYDAKYHPLRKPISVISDCRLKLEETAGMLIGRVDNEVLSDYNNLVNMFDKMITRLSEIDNVK